MKNKINTEKTLEPRKLTPREREILQLVAFGNSQKEIAVLLGISVFTVDVHLKNIKLKTHLQKVTELAAAYFFSRYHLPTLDIPERTRRTFAAAMLALSVFALFSVHSEMLRVRTPRATSKTAHRCRNKSKRSGTFEYSPLTA